MSFVRLARPIHYGNAGIAFNEDVPADDAYIFVPENTSDLWSACKNITERYGYDFGDDESGDIMLTTRNNPHVIVDLQEVDFSPAATLGVHPNAYSGTYIIASNGTTFSLEVNAARIDLVCPRAPGLGSWSFVIKRASDNVVMQSGSVSTADPTAPSQVNGGTQYYDFRSTVDGSNATVVTLYSSWYDAYIVELTAVGTAWADSLQLWYADPTHPLLPGSLGTDKNAIKVQATSAGNELRNVARIVGRRRAAVTDSAKLDTNPNNPANEFVVAVGVDKHSVADPTADNFVGTIRESIIYDDKIADEDFAQYLARVFIFRYRNPRPNAPIMHTLLPAVQLRDPIYAEEVVFQTIDAQSILWVSGIVHRITGTQATTDLETVSYAEFPSYETREDIDIDAHFNGQPMVNVKVNWTSLTNNFKQNLGPNVAVASGAGDLVPAFTLAAGASVDCAGKPWPPVPGTVAIRPIAAGSPATATLDQRAVRTNGVLGDIRLPGLIGQPTITIISYYHPSGVTLPGQNPTPPESARWTITSDKLSSRQFFWSFNSQTEMMSILRNGVGGPGGPYDWYAAEISYTSSPQSLSDGWVSNTPYHQYTSVDYAGRKIDLPWKQGDGAAAYTKAFSTCEVRYRALRGNQVTYSDPYAGSSPFYDPYTSEIGQLVNMTWDALVTGNWRISIRPVSQPELVVAWLTESVADAQNPEAHWQFFQAGSRKELSWDGVDQVGTWNQIQSQDYANSAKGAFDVDKPLVGSGFYVWNREQKVDGGLQLAVIGGDLPTSKPVFGHGTYGLWFINFEVKSDLLEERGVDYDSRHGRQRDTRALKDTPIAVAYSAHVYTHLPAPTTCAITINDWVSTTPFRDDLANTTANWGAADGDATVNNQKPVRMRFVVQARPGVLWAGKQDEVDIKLTRHVHLRANVADQFVVYEGTNYPGQDVEARRLVSRRFTNDDHTITFVDDGYRKAKSFKTSDSGDHAVGTEWIFTPSDFKKDFRGVTNEPIQFADYLQLEEVPSWSGDGLVAGARSRFQIAFMQYLFYLSAYTQDRSGRFAWCINTSFVDKSKILQSTDTATWPDDMNSQFRRSVIVRQWTNELVVGDDGVTRDYPSHLVAQYGPSSSLINLAKHYWKQHDPTQLGAWGGFQDDYLKWHRDHNSLPVVYAAANNAQLGRVGVGTALGSGTHAWVWESGPSFPPSVTRDFHGYYLLPPMVDKLPPEAGTDFRNTFIFAQVDGRAYREGGDVESRNAGDDVAGSLVWNSPIEDDSTAFDSTLKRFRPSLVVTPGTNPTLNVHAATLDYQRQDQLVHYEELRGIYSRGPRPAEAPKKIQPVGPYFQNVYTYGGVTVGRAYNQQGYYPLYKADVVGWFDFKFRREYIWESARLFPVTTWGAELTAAINQDRAKNFTGTVAYDPGAWTGYKDDGTPGAGFSIGPSSTAIADNEQDALHGRRPFATPANIFLGGYLPWAVCGRLSVTHDTIWHLVLINERRSVPV